MSSRPILERLAAAVDALRSLGETGNPVDNAETRQQYSREFLLRKGPKGDRNDLDQEVGRLPDLVRALLAADFEVRLEIAARDLRWRCQIEPGPDGLQAALEEPKQIEADLPDLAEEEVAVFEELKEALGGEGTRTFDSLLRRAFSPRPAVRVSLSAVLFKAPANARIEQSVSPSSARAVLFLFPSYLAWTLEKTPLGELETGCFARGRRTVFVVPGTTGALLGDHLAVCGRDGWAELDQALARPLPAEETARIDQALAFCDRQCDWPGRTRWLNPETFSVSSPPAAREPDAGALRHRIERLQALLSVLFLARRTRELDDGRFEVSFGDQSLRFPRSAVSAPPQEVADLSALYRFAYDGASVDKLELVRQFLALFTHVAAVVRRARTALQASERAHGRYLKKKVDDYFEAQRKTRDYVQEAVRDTEKSIVALTQEVAESVYKTFGAVALVAVAQALDTKLTAPAALVAAIALSVYMIAVLGYYLPTVARSQSVREAQYKEHIESFQDVLGSEETAKLLANERVKESWRDFRRKRHWATGIYVALLAASLGTAVYYALQIG